jgi:hypothetical protein
MTIHEVPVDLKIERHFSCRGGATGVQLAHFNRVPAAAFLQHKRAGRTGVLAANM